MFKFNVINIKVALSPSEKFDFVCFCESPLKMMKNTICFISEALFVLEVFTFLFRIFGYLEKRLDKKDISKFTTSQTGQQITAIQVLLPNISKSISQFLLKNHAQNMAEKLVPDSFI